MTGYEIVSSLLLFATLIAVVVYTGKTAAIAGAAVEQSEATQKPCVVIWTSYMDREPIPADSSEPVDWGVLYSGGLAIINIGNGPAFKVDFGFEGAPSHPFREDGSPSSCPAKQEPEIPAVARQPKEPFASASPTRA